MSIKLTSETLADEVNATSIVSFKGNSFKLSSSLFIVSKKPSTFLTSDIKINLGCVDLLLNILDKSVKTLGCSPTVNLSMRLWYSEIVNL